MLAALPFYFGLAVTAEPLVLVMLGDKWAEAIPIVRLLALAMPMMTLQVLFSPACDALGRPGIGVSNGAAGSLILAVGFLFGVQWGVLGLTAAWIACYPLYLAISCWRSLPVIGARWRDVASSVAAPLLAAAGMASVVWLIDQAVDLAPAARLAVLVMVGGAAYAGLLMVFAPSLVRQTIALVRNRG
jgi:O-antigen/teichoic acid export membrane protein